MPLVLPTWYPENAEEIYKKCCEENNVDPQTKFDIYADNPELRSHLLCKSKALNVYTEDEGFHVDRMTYLYCRHPEDNSNDPFLQDCVNKNKNISSHDEKVYKTLRCIADFQKKP